MVSRIYERDTDEIVPTVLPCPVCGKPGAMQCDRCNCSACGFSHTPDIWNRLSKASALLDALMGLDEWKVSLSCTVILDRWHCSVDGSYVITDTLADGLISLAERLEQTT